MLQVPAFEEPAPTRIAGDAPATIPAWEEPVPMGIAGDTPATIPAFEEPVPEGIVGDMPAATLALEDPAPAGIPGDMPAATPALTSLVEAKGRPGMLAEALADEELALTLSATFAFVVWLLACPLANCCVVSTADGPLGGTTAWFGGGATGTTALLGGGAAAG